MVSWGGLGGRSPPRNLRYPCLAPRGGGSGGLRPLRNLRYPCLAPAATMPCPRALPPIYAYDHKTFLNFFVQIFSEFCSPIFFGFFSSELFSDVHFSSELFNIKTKIYIIKCRALPPPSPENSKKNTLSNKSTTAALIFN